MMPLVIDTRTLSRSIREKKKKMAESSPEMIGTSPVPDMNAQDIYDMEQHARIEETLDSPEKSNSDQTMLDESYQGVGVSPDEQKRMARLRSSLAQMKMSKRM